MRTPTLELHALAAAIITTVRLPTLLLVVAASACTPNVDPMDATTGPDTAVLPSEDAIGDPRESATDDTVAPRDAGPWITPDAGPVDAGPMAPRLCRPVDSLRRDAIARLGAGGSHNCLIQTDGRTRCWGAITLEPDATTPAFVQVTDAAATACAVTADGSAYCWGNNLSGQFGDGTQTSSTRPTRVVIEGVAAIATGGAHTCARMIDGTVQCWGDNGLGQVGDGTATLRHLVPVVVPGLTGVVEVVSGLLHTCARLSDCTVRCWGANWNGQLGDGTTDDRTSHLPAPVVGLTGVAQLAIGTGTCALLSDGTVSCWGPVPTGTTASAFQATPTPIAGLANVVQLARGTGHACVILADTTVRCWGDGTFGQLGNGETGVGHLDAVAAMGLVGVTSIALGFNHSCARLATDAIHCWGSNDRGQLGDGTTMNRSVPTRVRF